MTATTESVLQLLDAETKKQADRAAKAERAYYALVREAADGEVSDAGKVPKVLSDAGRTADDLRRDLQTLQDRQKWREQLDRKQAMESEVATMQAEIDALWREFSETKERCGKRQRELVEKQAELRGAIVGLQDAEQKLRAVHLQPEAGLARLDLENELRALTRRRDGLQELARRAGDKLKSLAPQRAKFAKVRNERNPQFARELTPIEYAEEQDVEARVRDAERTQTDLQARLASCDAEIARVEAELAEFDEAALVP